MKEKGRIWKELLFISDTKLICILTHQGKHLIWRSRVPYSELYSGKKCLIIILLKSSYMSSTVVSIAHILSN